jgi:hypothetical protein
MAGCRFTSLPLSIADIPSLENFYCEGNPLKFPEPAVYERGGNDEVLRHIRQIANNRREQAAMEDFRQKKGEEKAAKAAARMQGFRHSSVSGSLSDEGEDTHSRGSGGRPRVSRTSVRSSQVPMNMAGGSIGSLLWKNVRRVVMDGKKEREAVNPSGTMDLDMLLRARELKTSVMLVNAKDDLVVIEKDLEAAEQELHDADVHLVACVQEIHVLKEKMRTQRGLMRDFKTISVDYLRDLQLRLRGCKGTLRTAVEWKRAADVGAHEVRTRLVSKRAAEEALRAARDDVAGEQAARAHARVMEKMSKRREDVEAIRHSAEDGEVAMEKAKREGRRDVLQRANADAGVGGPADTESRRQSRMSVTLDYHQRMGMEKGTESAARTSAGAWGRIQTRQSVGISSALARTSQASSVLESGHKRES